RAQTNARAAWTVPAVSHDEGARAAHERERALEPRATEAVAEAWERVLIERLEVPIPGQRRGIGGLQRREPVRALPDGDGRLEMTHDDVAIDGGIEGGDEQAVVAARMPHRDGAHGVAARAVGVQPLHLAAFETPADAYT